MYVFHFSLRARCVLYKGNFSRRGRGPEEYCFEFWLTSSRARASDRILVRRKFQIEILPTPPPPSYFHYRYLNLRLSTLNSPSISSFFLISSCIQLPSITLLLLLLLPFFFHCKSDDFNRHFHQCSQSWMIKEFYSCNGGRVKSFKSESRTVNKVFRQHYTLVIVRVSVWKEEPLHHERVWCMPSTQFKARNSLPTWRERKRADAARTSRRREIEGERNAKGPNPVRGPQNILHCYSLGGGRCLAERAAAASENTRATLMKHGPFFSSLSLSRASRPYACRRLISSELSSW